MTRRAPIFVGLALLLLALPAPGWAGFPAPPPGADAWLYETAERVKFDLEKGVIFRDAVSPVMGFAKVGTPLCPSGLLANVPGLTFCTIIGVGKDAVSTATGTGPVSGTFYVVVDIPSNPSVHVPDLPVISGTFKGQISPVGPGLPLLTLTGSFTIGKVDYQHFPLMDSLVGDRVPFNGIFRIPIGDKELGIPSQFQNPDNAYYFVGGANPFVPLQASERSIGFPAVRLEIFFGPVQPGHRDRDRDERDRD